MSDKRLTAVEWLIEQLEEKAYELSTTMKLYIEIDVTKYLDIKRQAKALEREQIVESYIEGRKDCELDWYPQKHASDYFTKTYGDNVKNDLQNGVNL